MPKKKDTLRRDALDYHQFPTPGKFSIHPTKDMANARDLSLAYSPGVAVPCEEIAKNPDKARDYTTRGNVVAVITNGTAVLGLGNIGPLASKPVMEGKAVLFKKFANIDAIDIEVDETDPDKFIEIVASLEPSFGGINLEDIKAPECFEIERKLRERMNIPVFHDDQHGTAIIVAAAVYNWARLTKRKLKDVRMVTSGAGASAIACLNMLVSMGVKPKNIFVTDRKGVIYKGRNPNMEQERARFAQNTKHRSLEDVIKKEKLDLFLGLSAPGVLNPKWLKQFNKNPFIMALANPTPEIMPEEVHKIRADAYMATGRSDYPNQVNNVLCFPFIFRGALDVGATVINEEIKVACVKAIADLATNEANEAVTSAYGGESLTFGKNYLIPKPFDPRLMVDLPMAVAKAAMDSKVATRPIKKFKLYEQKLESFVSQANMVMRPVYDQAIKGKGKQRIIYAEGEEYNVLQAVQNICDDGIAYPILVGRRHVLEARIEKLGLRLKEGQNFELVDPQNDARYHEYWTYYHEVMQREGVTPAGAKTVLRTNATVIGAILLNKGEGDALICGTVGHYHFHLRHVMNLVPLKEGVNHPAALCLLMMPEGNKFICDTHVNPDPTAEEIADMTIMAADEVRRFGIEPKAALLSHSNFGSHHTPSALKMRTALEILHRRAPELEVEGEMHGDAALKADVRDVIFPHSHLKGSANLLVMPNIDSASISYNLLKSLSDTISVGPILMGLEKPVHILHPAVRARGLVNISTLAAADIYETKIKGKQRSRQIPDN